MMRSRLGRTFDDFVKSHDGLVCRGVRRDAPVRAFYETVKIRNSLRPGNPSTKFCQAAFEILDEDFFPLRYHFMTFGL
jgi:hypothetical protein